MMQILSIIWINFTSEASAFKSPVQLASCMVPLIKEKVKCANISIFLRHCICKKLSVRMNQNGEVR